MTNKHCGRVAGAGLIAVLLAPAASFAQVSPSLGTAGTFSVLAGSSVTNTGSTTISGDVGISPGIGPTPHFTGFGTVVLGGTMQDATTAAGNAMGDKNTAYTALDQGCTVTYAGAFRELAGTTLGPGVYCATQFLLSSGTLTLSGIEDNDSGRVLVSSGTLLLAKTSAGAVHGAAVDATIRGGTLALGGTGNDQIWDGTTVTMFGGSLDLGGTNETFQSLFGNAGIVTNSGGANSILTLGNGTAANNASSLYGGIIQNGTTNSMGLGKTGNGAVVLTGANTYTGDTTITGGYVQIGNGGTTGSLAAASNIITSTNTQLVFNRTDNITFANTISGAGGLVQNGTGILEIPFGTTDTYTGPTVVNSGELAVNGSAAFSAVTLNPGAILSGSGTVGAVGSRGGIIRPGTSPGIITTGSVVVDSDTVFQYEVNGTVAGTSYDQINSAGIVDLTDSSLILTVGFAPVNGNKVWLWLNDLTDSITGNWLGLPEGALIGTPSDYWIISYNDDNAGNPTAPTNNLGNDISLYYVPEPSAALLTGVAGLLALGRRRRVS